MDKFASDAQINDLATALRLFKESRTAFLKLFDTSPICMSMTSTELSNRVYVRVNQKFLEIFGVTKEEIIGRNSITTGILDPEESARVGEMIRVKGGLHNDYVKARTKDGRTVHTISSIEPMELDGEPLLVAFFVDISELIEQRALIERHSQQLLEINRELEAFSYTVSHDLRTPLRGIEGCAKLLEELYGASIDDDGKKLIAMVRQGAARMSTLIEDLLEFARLGKKSVEKARIDMNDMVNDILQELKRSMNHKATVHVGKLHVIQGDLVLMRQVMLNLISNAIKFSSKKADPQIDISSLADRDMIAFTVSDNGAGFDMQHATRLFSAFQRLHARSDFEGTGVGLATVERIITHHGGTIAAEGEVGKGARFTFRVPGD